jgi:hypothetical protein
MKKIIEEFTGTIGVGCLLSLGLFFLTDSKFRYWIYIEELTKTNSWGILVSVPLLIINYILGLITIEIGELIFPHVYAKNIQKQFREHFGTVIEFDNRFLADKYNEINQNKRILNGSSIACILIGIGVFFEGLPLSSGYRIIGVIGLIGCLIIAGICPFISKTIQSNFNYSVQLLRNKANQA